MTDSSSTERQRPYRVMLLFGPPGSGKGTQGKIISAIPGFFHCATGDMFRGLDPASDAAREMQQYMGRGLLVPDKFTVELWRNHMRGLELTTKFDARTQILVLDGIPRSVNQAKMLEGTIEVVRIIHLKADIEKMVQRLRARALKENRVDDADEEVIRRRMNVYERETRPLLNHYPRALVAEIDALMSPLRVLRAIVDVLLPLAEKAES